MELNLGTIIALIKKYSSGSEIDTSTFATKTELGTKVDKITGKGLSTNDYTTAEKTKLSGLSNADVTKSYVDTELAKKLNSAGHVLTTNDYTTAEKNKLAGLSNFTLPKLNATTPLAEDADLLAVITAFNTLVADLKAKGYMS